MVVKYMTMLKENGKIYLVSWFQIERQGKKPITIWTHRQKIGEGYGKKRI